MKSNPERRDAAKAHKSNVGPAAAAAFAMFHGNKVQSADISLASLLPRPENAEHPSVIWRNTVLAPRMAANRAEADRLNEERDFITSVTANGRRYNRERRKDASFQRCGFCGGTIERATTQHGVLYACFGCHQGKRLPKKKAEVSR